MANRELSFSLGAGVSSTAATEDQELGAELYKLYNAINTVALKLDEYTAPIPLPASDRPYVSFTSANKADNVSRLYGYATVALIKGTIVYWNASGQLAKHAASTGGMALIVLEDTALGGYAPVARNGVVDGFVGLTTGTAYVASVTAGAIATSVVTGNARRFLGYALSPTVFYFCPDIIGISV